MRGGRPGPGQVVQDAVGDAVARHPGEVLLDRLEGGGQVRGFGEVGRRAGVHGDREQCGEPADGTGQFGLEADGLGHDASLAAVSLQLDVGEGLVLAAVAAPPGEGDGERGEQYVVDARMEPRGDGAQQRGRVPGPDADGPGPLPGDGVGPGERTSAQRGVRARQRPLEVSAVRVEVRAFQQLGPTPERRAHPRQFDRGARDVPAPCRGQVVHQDPPGHTVDHDMVGDQDQLPRLAAPHRTQHHAVVRVEPSVASATHS